MYVNGRTRWLGYEIDREFNPRPLSRCGTVPFGRSTARYTHHLTVVKMTSTHHPTGFIFRMAQEPKRNPTTTLRYKSDGIFGRIIFIIVLTCPSRPCRPRLNGEPPPNPRAYSPHLIRHISQGLKDLRLMPLPHTIPLIRPL